MIDKEIVNSDIKQFIFSGKDPHDIVNDITEYIMGLGSTKKKFVNNIKSDVAEWIDKWIELFPRGVRTGGKLVRSDRNICLKKMVDFITKYPMYSVSDIFMATQNYVRSFEDSQYAFIKAATYFIDKKGEGSELAACCDNLLFHHEEKDEFAQEEGVGFFG